ncbi:MAG: hypothetical protein AAF360_15680, partial [Pseudomonadota bacterium]
LNPRSTLLPQPTARTSLTTLDMRKTSRQMLYFLIFSDVSEGAPSKFDGIFTLKNGTEFLGSFSAV